MRCNQVPRTLLTPEFHHAIKDEAERALLARVRHLSQRSCCSRPPGLPYSSFEIKDVNLKSTLTAAPLPPWPCASVRPCYLSAPIPLCLITDHLKAHPLDQAKYRMQVLRSSTPLLQTLTHFAARDGILSLWRGLSASILRQSTYSTARFGLYTVLSRSAQKYASPNDPKKPLSTAWTVACAGAAGGLAGLLGNPTEVVLVRMCADGARPEAERFGYRNGLVGLWRVAREEGLGAFGKGLSANVTRSVLMSTLVPGLLVWALC